MKSAAITSGAGKDAFVFTCNSGDAEVADFQDNADGLDLSAFRFAPFTAVSSRATNVAGGLLLEFTDIGGDTVFLAGMTKAAFGATDVIL